MQETRIPIDGEKLAKRWGILPIDLLFMIMNHELKTIDQLGDYVDTDVVFEVYSEANETFDFPSLMFSFTDVKKLEDEYLGDQLSMKRVVIRGQSLMNKWDMDGAEIFAIAFQEGWDFFDPFGFPINDYYESILKLCNDQILKISDVLFQLTDIEKFESEKGLQLSKQNETVADFPFSEDKMDEKDGIPLISFYKKGQMWLIGEKDKEIPFIDLIGFEFIRFLLRYPEKRHDSVKVFHIGNIPDKLKGHLYEKDFHKQSDPETIKTVLQHKSELEEELKETIDSEHRQWLDSEIEKCEKFLKEAKKSFPGSSEKFRTKVLNGIKRAIKAIEKESKNSKSLELVPENLQLKNPFRTIFTGNPSHYSPNSESPVDWQLDPPVE